MADLISYGGKMYHPSALDSMRQRALASQDSLSYADLSDALGISPEDQSLYEMGLAERIVAGSGHSQEPESAKASAKTGSIEDFLKAGRSINLNDYVGDASLKAYLLQSNFPKFAEGGRQDISDYDDYDIGRLFKEIYQNYSSRSRHKR